MTDDNSHADEKQLTTNRRRALKSIGAGGLTGGIGVFGSPTISFSLLNSSADNETEIIYGYARSDPENMDTYSARKKHVPTDWYDQLQRAYRTRESVDYIKNDGVKGVWVVPGEYGGDNSHLRVEVDTEAKG